MALKDTSKLLGSIDISQELLHYTADHAQQIDSGEMSTRDVLPMLADESLLDLGAPLNTDGGLVQQASVLEALARQSLSVPFAAWGHRMVIEFLTLAGGNYADAVLPGLRAGTIPASSAMASGYKSLAGIGDLDLHIQRERNGKLYLSGRIGWASNLYRDAIVVAPAYGPDTDNRQGSQGGVIVAFSLDAPGAQIGPDLDILALRGTASTYVSLNQVEVCEDQILTTDFIPFLQRSRPTLSILQASLCLGLATAASEHARPQITGVNHVIHDELQTCGEQLAATKQQLVKLASRVGTNDPPHPRDVLAMRLKSGQLASQLTNLELKTAGGKAFITTSGTNRRYREATFIPLQAPSETQLRWELSHA